MSEKHPNDGPVESGLRSDDKNDINNYTEVDSEFFDQVYRDVGNYEEILKIKEGPKKKHPKYYVWTDFLGVD